MHSPQASSFHLSAYLTVIRDVDRRTSTKGEPWEKRTPRRHVTGTSHAAVPHIRSQSDSRDIHAAAADLQPLSLADGGDGSWNSLPLFLSVAHHPRAPSVFSLCLSVSPVCRANTVARVALPRRDGPIRARVVLGQHRSRRRRPVFFPYDLSLSRAQTTSLFSISRDRRTM